VTELEQRLAGGAEFVVGTGLTATDSEWAKREIARKGLNRDNGAEDRKAIGEIWQAAKLTTRAFKMPNGTYALQAKGPGGTLLNAKLVLASFVASDETVDLGPYKSKKN
jgi:hypothetical protein